MTKHDAPLDVSRVQRFLLDAPYEDDGGAAFMRGLANALVLAGFPSARVSYALITKHPELLWRTVQWHAREDEVVVRDQTHARLDDEFYTKSPVAVVRGGSSPIRVRLVRGQDLRFPICEDLFAKGFSDYFVMALPFANGQVGYVSFVTRVDEGFTNDVISAFESLRPFLARRIELESSYYGTRALLDVYLGKNAGRRVFEGAFQRGKGELIDAAIWFSDMRDFTALTDRTPPAEVIKVLDAYFDAVATAIGARGGEVLKFIGDAVMAIFPVDGDAARACKNALAAADEAFAALATLNGERAARGELAIAIGVALHRGNVMYGNIGARDRLDFTVISSSVNEASRLESLCKKLDTPLALSEAFANAAGASADDIVDLGAHELKGVAAPIRVFTPRKYHRG